MLKHLLNFVTERRKALESTTKKHDWRLIHVALTFVGNKLNLIVTNHLDVWCLL